MDAYRLVAGLDEFKLLGLLDNKLQEVLGALVGGNFVPKDAPNELKLSYYLVGHAACENGHRRLVLRQQVANVSRVCYHDDYVDV